MQIAIIVIGLVVIGAIVGSVINFGSLFLGIPLALIFIGLVVGKEAMERQRKVMQMKRFRREARAQKAELSEADKRTMV
jgi:uncharacterized membrane protein